MSKNIIVVLLIVAAIIVAQFSCESASSASRSRVTVIECTLVSRSATSTDVRTEYRENILIDGEPYFVFKSITKLDESEEVVFVRLSDSKTALIKDAWSWTQKNGKPLKSAVFVKFLYK